MKEKLLKSTLLVALMTGISRLSGLLRDVVIAAIFGAGASLDAFIVAFRLPNFLRRLFAEGGFSQAFVPVLSEYKTQRRHADVKALLDHTVAVLSIALLATTVIGVLAAPVLIIIFAPGFSGDMEKQMLATDMLRITFPYILFISLTAMAGGILNTYQKFAVPAFTPVLLNLSLIGCAIYLAPSFPKDRMITALAFGVLIAGIAQLLFQFPSLIKLRLLPVPRLNRDKAGVSRIITLMIPTLFAVSITQINLLIDTLIASFLQTGSISWLYFSDRLVEFPLGVFGIALATVILPSLSVQHVNRDNSAYSKTLDWAIRWVLLISVPAALGLAILSAPLLATIFHYNAFSAYDVEKTSHSLIAYAAGLPAFILIKVLSSGFFSRQDTRTPVRIAVIAMLCNVVLNILLVFPLAHAGLALATSLSACIHAILLYSALRADKGFALQGGWLFYLTKLTVGASAMTMCLLYYVPDQVIWLGWHVYERVLHACLWVMVGVIIYFSVLWLTGLRFHEMSKPLPETD